MTRPDTNSDDDTAGFFAGIAALFVLILIFIPAMMAGEIYGITSAGFKLGVEVAKKKWIKEP